jgi:MSHA biogenesis protein MshN
LAAVGVFLLRDSDVAREVVKPSLPSVLSGAPAVAPVSTVAASETPPKADIPRPAPDVPERTDPRAEAPERAKVALASSGPRQPAPSGKPATDKKSPAPKPAKPPGKQAAKASPGTDKPEAARRPPSTPDTQAVPETSIEKQDAAVQLLERADAIYRGAEAAFKQGRNTEARESLREALRIDGLHLASRQLLVKLLIETQRLDEAMEVLREGLQGQPAQTNWAMTLARLQVDRGDLDGAARTLRDSLPAASGRPDYLGFAGHLQQRLGNGKEAAELYRSATRLAPADGRWWLGLGLAMESEGMNDEALAAFQRARQCGNLSRELALLVQGKLGQ